MTWEGLDRRNFPRIVYPCMVKLKTDDGHEESLLAHTENIGVGGICVIIKREIKMFSKVDLQLDLVDTGDLLIASGRVVWSIRRKAMEAHKPMFYDIGIEFIELNAENQERLRNVILQMIKKGARLLKPYV